MFAVITAAVAVLSASGRALLMSRVESDVSPSTTASTRRGPGLGQPLRSESFGNWKVALRSWNMDAQQGSDRHVLRMTITNVSDELRTWSAYEQAALRYEVASPGGEINRYVRSPDRGGGPVDIDPRESLRAEYTWTLPRVCATSC